MIFFAFTISLMNGYLGSSWLFRKAGLNEKDALHFSWGTGIGISSVFFIILNFLHIPWWAILGLELVLLVYFWNKVRPQLPALRFSKNLSIAKLIGLVALIILFLDIFIFFVDSLKDPHGLYDAWSYWNLRAKFIARGPSIWQNAFKDLYFFHGDYPLMHSGFIARTWLWTGAESTLVPIITAFIYTFGTAGLLYSLLRQIRSSSSLGSLAAIALLATPFYMVMGDSQYVDSPLAYYFLGSIALLFIAEKASHKEWIYLFSGILAGFALWTKNEGFLFIAALLGARFVVHILSLKTWIKQELKWFLIGLAPVIVVTFYFKIFIAPANDLLQEGSGTLAEKLHDSFRYDFIWGAFKAYALSFGRWYTNPWWWLALAIVALGINYKYWNKNYLSTAIWLLTMLVGYFFIYVLSYIDLNFHISTSLHRLYFQLLPAFLFLFFAALKSPEQSLSNTRS